MAKGPQILTANRLSDGAVLYWQAGRWIAALADAEVFETDAAAKAALAAAARFVADREVVTPYLFEVRIEDGVAVPAKEREIIRATGPSVRRDLGKQAHQKSDVRNRKSEILRAPAGTEANLEGEGI
jgi:hypothetical protein